MCGFRSARPPVTDGDRVQTMVIIKEKKPLPPPTTYPKPQVLGTTRCADPRLSVVPGDDNADASRPDPRDDHERAVQLHQQLGRGLQWPDFRQRARLRGRGVGQVVVTHAALCEHTCECRSFSNNRDVQYVFVRDASGKKRWWREKRGSEFENQYC